MLKQLIKRKNLTQEELAKAIHIDPSNITRWFNGERKPQREDILKIIDFLREKGALEYLSEANKLLTVAGFKSLSDDLPEELKLIQTLTADMGIGERLKLVTSLAALAISTILLIFTLSLVVITPFFPDELVTGVMSLITGIYGFKGLLFKKSNTQKEIEAKDDSPPNQG